MVDRWALRAFYSSNSVRNAPLDVNIPRDFYAWNYRALATLQSLSESLSESAIAHDKNLTKSYEILRDLTKSYEILRDLTKSYEILRDLIYQKTIVSTEYS